MFWSSNPSTCVPGCTNVASAACAFAERFAERLSDENQELQAENMRMKHRLGALEAENRRLREQALLASTSGHAHEFQICAKVVDHARLLVRLRA
jgi:cell shape-determining protein MreC